MKCLLDLLFAMFLLVMSNMAIAEGLIQVGDLLRISLPGEESLNKDFAVGKDGRVILPEVGAVTVAGLTEVVAEKQIGSRLAQVLRDLSWLSVYVRESRLLRLCGAAGYD